MRRPTVPALLTAALLGGQLAVVLATPAQAAVVLPPSGPEPFSIGNRLFLDNGSDGTGGFNAGQRDNGLQDANEVGVNGVRVELYYDDNGNNQPDGDELVRFDITSAGAAGAGRPGPNLDGYYLFDDLPQGTYFVVVPAQNFAAGMPLGGWHSSTFNGTETVGAIGASGSPATDLDDNGIEPTNRRPDLVGVRSGPIVLADGVDEVTDETDLSHQPDPGVPNAGHDPTVWDGPGSIGRRTSGSQRDDASNVAVDFGFVPPMSIGNRVWLDDSSDPAQWAAGGTRNNGRMDATDDGNLTLAGLQNPGIAGVDLQLYLDANSNGVIDAGDILVASTTTNATGYYLFDGLAAGNYLVRVPSTEFGAGQPLNGLISSYDAATLATPTNQVDADDNGVDSANPAATAITSRQVQLRYLTESTGETDPSPQTQPGRGRFGETDHDSDLTIDFGFTRPPLSIGNQVWLDDHPTNQAKRDNGVYDPGEQTISGVEVALYRDLNNNGNVDAGEDTGLRDTTGTSGDYLFDNLPPGSYLVAITAANFNAGSPLENMISSRSVAPNPLPADNQVDGNDNGRDGFVAGIGIISSTINLAYGAESANDVVGPLTTGTHGERDNDSDLTVDFGFYVPMSLGNRVWLDDSTDPDAVGSTRDNAALDPADDRDNPNIPGVQGQGVAGVTVRLYRDLDADGVIDAGEDTGRTSTTNAGGYYLFDALTRGGYLVGVEASSFVAGAPLRHFRSSTNATAPTDDGVDGTDKGRGQTASPTRPDPTFGVLSPTITLGYASATSGSEPAGESDPSPQTQAARGSNGERDAFSDLTVDFGFVLTEPAATNDTYSLAFGASRTVAAPGVLGNDTDHAGAGLTAELVTDVQHGSLTFNTNGSFTYVPQAGFEGSDSFTYRAKDVSVSSAPATVTLTVAPNTAPTADDDSYSTPFETAKVVGAPGVLDGDVDPEGKPLSAVLADGPSMGTLTLNPDGSFTYTPDQDATGDDTFTYRAADGYATSDPATVTITIGADPNRAPVAVDDSYTTPFQTRLDVDAPGLLANDTDADDDALSVATLVRPPAHGLLGYSADGSFTYVPNPGYAGPDSFTYRARDGRRLSNIATVELTVEADTTPPVATFDAPTGPINSPIDVELEFSEPVTGLEIDDFTTSNGTASDLTGSGRSYDLTLTPAGSGTVTLTLDEDAVIDAAGNGNAAATLTRVADLAAPVITLSTPPGPVNGPFTVTIELSEPAATLTDADLSVTGGTLSTLTGSGTTYSVQVTPTTDGPVTLTVAADAVTDTAGNTSATTSITRTADLTAPGVELDADPGPFNAPFTVDITFDEPVTGLTASDVDVTNGTATDLTGSDEDWTVTINPTTDGDVEIALPAGAATDAAGNPSTAADPITRRSDTTAPAATFDAPTGPINSPIDVELEFSEPVTGLEIDDFTTSNGTASDLTGSGRSYDLTLTPAGSGTVTLTLDEDAVIDAAGNGNAAATLTRVADLAAPVITLSTPPGPVNGPFTVSIELSEPAATLTDADLSVTGGTLSTLTGSGTTYSVQVTPTTDGPVTLTVAADAVTDTAGNTSATTSITRTADLTAPGVELDADPGPFNAPFTVDITFDEPVTGLTASDVDVTNGTATDLTGSDEDWTVTINPTTDGDVEIALPAGAATDAAGNPSTAADPITRRSDTTAPTATLSAPNRPVSGPFRVAITFSEPVTGLDLGDLEIVNGSASALAGSGSSYTVTVTPTGEGTVTVRLPAGATIDTSGQPNVAASLSRTADLTAPRVRLSTTAEEPITDASIRVDITFSEPVDGLGLADLAVTGGTLSELTGDGATYAVTLTFDPDGDLATVGLPAGAATDPAGNPSAAAADLVIDRDGSAPTLTITPGAGQPDPVRGDRVVFAVTADEPVSDLAAGSLELGGTAGATTATVERTGPATFEVVVTGMTASGEVTLSVGAGAVSDPTGNASAAAGPVTIAWAATAAPTITVLPGGRCLPDGVSATIPLALTPDADARLTITSSDTSVVPTSRVTISGRGGGDEQVLLRLGPLGRRTGTAFVTVTATTASGTDHVRLRVVVGSRRGDDITGTAGPDVVLARGGDDVVRGRGGMDLLCGGDGDDRLVGGAGVDALYGQAGDDRLVGPGPLDVLVGGPGRNVLVGGQGRAG